MLVTVMLSNCRFV